METHAQKSIKHCLDMLAPFEALNILMIQKTLVSLQPFCAKRILNYFSGLGSSSQNGYVNAQVIEEYTLEMNQGESVDYPIEQRL